MFNGIRECFNTMLCAVSYTTCLHSYLNYTGSQNVFTFEFLMYILFDMSVDKINYFTGSFPEYLLMEASQRLCYLRV